ncbi:unnamed protein product [Adineta ricciae]|uniref:UBC core domain-containing protein n=1 Tax=Adineta ricciae TaxID=249248 RepID=A0A815D098_ADIRI|nr:unnamed protein product [Adineta ricciae]
MYIQLGNFQQIALATENYDYLCCVVWCTTQTEKKENNRNELHFSFCYSHRSVRSNQSKIQNCIRRHRVEYNDANSDVKFVLERSPFDNDDDDDDNEKITGVSSNRLTIIGRIFPNSAIYREGSFRIEIALPAMYPSDPPEIRFLTPIYHISVTDDGRLSSETVKRDLLWSPRRSLVEIIRALVDYIDHPNLQFILNHEIAGEFMYNRAEFDRKALMSVCRHITYKKYSSKHLVTRKF